MKIGAWGWVAIIAGVILIVYFVNRARNNNKRLVGNAPRPIKDISVNGGNGNVADKVVIYYDERGIPTSDPFRAKNCVIKCKVGGSDQILQGTVNANGGCDPNPGEPACDAISKGGNGYGLPYRIVRTTNVPPSLGITTQPVGTSGATFTPPRPGTIWGG